MRIVYIFIINILGWTSLTYAQEIGCEYISKLITKEAKINLPCEYKLNKTNYEEGVFFTFNYKDSITVSIFDGTMVGLPLLNEKNGYIIKEKIEECGRRIIWGIKDDKYWREDSITSMVRVLYINVSEEKMNMYNKVLDSFEILTE